jgi:hypothetical protein
MEDEMLLQRIHGGAKPLLPGVDRVLDWRPDIVLAAGPPLYLDQ